MLASIKLEAEALQKESERMKKVEECFQYLKDYEIYIGIPMESNSASSDSSIRLAELLYIHENGSPVRGIPARPVLEASMNHNKELISENVEKVLKYATDGNLDGLKTAMEKLGLLVSGKAKSYFTEGNAWAPNTPETIKRKGSDKPLIDTGTTQKAITHVIDKKGSRGS